MPNESTNITKAAKALVLVAAEKPASDSAAGVKKWAGAADITESGGEAGTNDIETFDESYQVAGTPSPSSVAVQTPALNTSHPAVKLAVSRFDSQDNLWAKYETREETLLPVADAAVRTVAISRDKSVAFGGSDDTPDLVDVEPGDAIVWDPAGVDPKVLDIETVDPDTHAVTVQADPGAALAPKPYRIVVPAKTRGWFPARVTSDPAQSAVPVGGAVGGVLNLAPPAETAELVFGDSVPEGGRVA